MGIVATKHDSSSKHAICAKYFENQFIISRFLKEESEILIQEDFGHVLGNGFLADSIK